VTELSDARFRAAAALRRLGHALAAHDADAVTLDDVAARLDALVPDLRAAPRREREVPSFDEIASGPFVRQGGTDGEARSTKMADRAVAGEANPMSVDMTVRREGDEGVADVVFGPAFEGALGRVHGGMVAAVFDDIAGFALAFVGKPGFSGRLEVAFRAPVPTEVPVEFRVRMEEQRGRRIIVTGEARLDGTVLATTRVLMITVDQEHFETHARELLGRVEP
jgi:acyl-coenzyme A thioesterase PaaI-like protein